VQNTPATGIFQSVSSSSNSYAWACGYGGTLVRTTNAGSNWLLANGNISSARDIFNIWAIDSLVAVVAASNTSFNEAYIYKTTNGGVNWSQTFFQSSGFINAISFINSTTGFAAGDPVGGRWGLFRTTDAGSTWDSTGLYLPAIGSEVGHDNSLFYEGSKIWFGTQSGKIYFSSNSGSTWTSSQTPMNSVSRIYFNDALSGIGFSGCENTAGVRLAKTTNGSVWVNGNSIEDLSVRGICGIKGSSTYWITYSNNIYATTNNGNNWSPVFNFSQGGFIYNLTSSRSGEYPRTIYGCTSNGKIIVGNTNTIGIKLLSSEIPDRFELKQNYPNPFNPTTKINFKVREKGFVSLKVFDINGKEISKLVSEIINAGSYSVEFNSFGLPSGTYYYRMESNLISETKKMILIK
jgi:photosystem II stability/assembly factor-like uncharacterized protein